MRTEGQQAREAAEYYAAEAVGLEEQLRHANARRVVVNSAREHKERTSHRAQLTAAWAMRYSKLSFAPCAIRWAAKLDGEDSLLLEAHLQELQAHDDPIALSRGKVYEEHQSGFVLRRGVEARVFFFLDGPTVVITRICKKSQFDRMVRAGPS